MKNLAIIVVLCLAALPLGAETIDRVVATVNGHPILQSDVNESAAYEAFVEGKALERITAADLRATLERLIDQELLSQQMGQMAPEISSASVQEKLAEIRKQHPGTTEQWRNMLETYGLDEAVFAARLEHQLRTMAFLDRRLRPSVLVERTAVENYYRDTLLPQLHKAGTSQEPPLADVQREIREILTQQGMDQMLTTWLHNLRQQSRIRLLLEDTKVASTEPDTSAK